VADGMFNRAFAVGVTHARRVTHHAVVLQGGGIDSVELGLVQVGFDDTLLEVVQLLWRRSLCGEPSGGARRR
jgi:hypothetical protein